MSLGPVFEICDKPLDPSLQWHPGFFQVLGLAETLSHQILKRFIEVAGTT
jgi:hypothetical protein